MKKTELYRVGIALLDNGDQEKDYFFDEKDAAENFFTAKFSEIKRNFETKSICSDDYSEFIFWKGIENLADIWKDGRRIENYSTIFLEKIR